MKHYSTGSALLALLSFSPLMAPAAVYTGSAWEPFDYNTAVGGDTAADGNLGANSGGFGFNATGDSSLPNTTVWGTGTGVAAAANASISSGSLSGPLGSTGNRATFAAGTAGRALGQTVDAGSLYISYLTDRNNDSIRTVNFALFGVATGASPATVTERFGFGQYATATAGTSSDGNFAMVFLNSNPANLILSDNPIPYETNVTHQVILRIDFDDNGLNDRMRVYLDPTSLTDESSLVPYLDNADFDLGAITNFRPFSGAAAGTLTAGSGDFDEIRVGSTFAAVTIPEPTGMALAAIGLTTLLRRRRRCF